MDAGTHVPALACSDEPTPPDVASDVVFSEARRVQLMGGDSTAVGDEKQVKVEWHDGTVPDRRDDRGRSKRSVDNGRESPKSRIGGLYRPVIRAGAERSGRHGLDLGEGSEPCPRPAPADVAGRR